MNKVDSIIFDLDGTLWDTCASCAIAWNNVLQRHQIPFREIITKDVRIVASKPHEVCIRETFEGLSERHIQLLITGTMEEDNIIVKKLGGHIYAHVGARLRILSQKVPLYIVSNCQAGYIETFLEYSGFGRYFKDFECWGNTGESKSKNLAQVILRNKLNNPIYVGDAQGDYIAARDCKVPFYFMEYGFGTATGYDYSFSSFSQFADYADTIIGSGVLHIRKAQVEDAEELSSLAMRSKSYWPYPKEYLASCVDLIKFDHEYISHCPVLVAVIDQVKVGVASIKIIQDDPRLDNLWIDPKFMGRGIGRVLFNECVKEALKLNWTFFRIAADPYALGFYEKMGTISIGSVQSRIKSDLILPYLEKKFKLCEIEDP